MNAPSLVPGFSPRVRNSPDGQSTQATVVRLRAHGTPTPSGSAPPPASKSDGTSALAVPVTGPPPRRLHAVGSESERKWLAQLAVRITGAAVEVLAGHRPAQQLAVWMHRDVLASLQLRASLSRRDTPGAAPELALAHRGATVRSSRACMIRPGVYEASAVVSDQLRCRAVALRFELAEGVGWRVTALEIG